MVRYADDFVILAKRIDKPLIEWVESQLEGRFRLTINPSKTRTVDLKEPSASVHFLGYTFRFDRDLFGRGGRYLNVFPSKRSLARFRDRVRELTASRRGLVPVNELVRDVSRHLAGWGRYLRRVIRDVFSTVLIASCWGGWFATCNVGVSVPDHRTGSRSWPICKPSGCSYWNRPWENVALIRVRADLPDMPMTRTGLRLTVLGKAGCGKSACPV